MIKVGVLGAAGRMGSTVCGAVEADPELELVARVDMGDDREPLKSADVVVDFTAPSAVKDNVKECLDRGLHVVVGTTGLSDADLTEIAGWADGARGNVFVAPNFALGAVLMMKFAAQAAALYDTAEIIERHHENKVDAPSGTALRTASLMNEARAGKPWSSKRGDETLAGSRGGEGSGVHIHSLRVPGSVAHQEVIFGGPGETLTIRHDSLDRSSFMPGVLLAIKKVGSHPGLTVGLEHLLN